MSVVDATEALTIGQDDYGWWADTPDGVRLHCGSEVVARQIAAGEHAAPVQELVAMVARNQKPRRWRVGTLSRVFAETSRPPRSFVTRPS